MKTIRLIVELINVPDECTAEKFRTKLEEGELPSCIADNFGIVAANMADKNIEDLDNFQFTIIHFLKMKRMSLMTMNLCFKL